MSPRFLDRKGACGWLASRENHLKPSGRVGWAESRLSYFSPLPTLVKARDSRQLNVLFFSFFLYSSQQTAEFDF